nr:DUF6114 domain-containing protein [Antrihabitans stalactiti]
MTAVHRARVWFKSFRRTRPFWGGLWLTLGGWLVLRLSMVSIQIVMSTGIVGFGGWLTGGGMIACGLLAWCLPSQRYVAGIIGLLLAVASLLVSNFGGLLLGMVFGMVGSSMVISWGPKKPLHLGRKIKGALLNDGRPVIDRSAEHESVP